MTGKYENILGAAGALADQDLTAITGKPSAVFAGAAVNLGKSFDQAIASAVPPPPPPPPTGKTLMGASFGTLSPAKLLAMKPKIIRCFNPSQAAAVTAGIAIAYSNDGGRPAQYALATGSTTVAALEREWRTAFGDDTVQHRLILLHEEDIVATHGGDYVRWARVYAAARPIVDRINQGRKFPVLLASTTTGMPYDSNAYKNWDCKAVDEIGIDNYARKHWDTVDAFAKSLGKPWCVPETGIQAQTDPKKYSDDQQLAAMIADYALYNGKAAWVTYWPAGGNDLNSKPKSLAQLGKYFAA